MPEIKLVDPFFAWRSRLTAAMILAGYAVQRNGLGLWLARRDIELRRDHAAALSDRHRQQRQRHRLAAYQFQPVEPRCPGQLCLARPSRARRRLPPLGGRTKCPCADRTTASRASRTAIHAPTIARDLDHQKKCLVSGPMIWASCSDILQSGFSGVGSLRFQADTTHQLRAPGLVPGGFFASGGLGFGGGPGALDRLGGGGDEVFDRLFHRLQPVVRGLPGDEFAPAKFANARGTRYPMIPLKVPYTGSCLRRPSSSSRPMMPTWKPMEGEAARAMSRCWGVAAGM